MVRKIIRTLRELNGIKSKEMAQIIGVTNCTYSLFETGKLSLNNDNLKKIEAYLNDNYYLAEDNKGVVILPKKGE